ncbi:MAG: sulfur carrier protein ThiS [Bacteroides sp.]|nr:sulfur carrier protein ThiS [Ruminococcus flavefaciens]MCM1555715.1 sulfur carrier protein ThiS [Bacteroides sp.]
MNIFLNEKPLLIEEGTTLAGLMRSKNLLAQGGIALALNNSVVPKEKWEHTVLRENDMLLLIGASYGG